MRYLSYLFILFFCLVNVVNAQAQQSWVYVVSDGDNLWDISKKFLDKVERYTDLQKINQIKHPKKIPPGTLLRIPMQWIKHQPTSAKITFYNGHIGKRGIFYTIRVSDS